MNKSELIDSIANNTGESKKTVGSVLDGFINTIQTTLKQGDKVSLPGFGTFEKRHRSARTARNPQTGANIDVPETDVPAFKPGAGFKDAMKS